MASEKITAMIEEVKALSVLELNELVKALEEEFGVSAAAVAAAPAAGAGARAVHFDGGGYPGHGDARFGDAAHAAGHHALGHGLPHREYARCPAMGVVRHPGTVVYRRRAQADDRRAAV